jgi:transcriptional regulator with XRE-family HTH domain
MRKRQKLGAAIRKRRQELGFASQEKFAQWAGMDRAQYGRIERGDANISFETLCDLAGHLGVAPHRLIKDITLDDSLLAEAAEKAS